jgi:integrase
MWYEGEDANGKARKRTLNVGKSADVAKVELQRKKAGLMTRIVGGKDTPESESEAAGTSERQTLSTSASALELKQLPLADALLLYLKDLADRESVGAIKTATTTAGTNIVTAFVQHVGEHKRVMDVTRSEALGYIAKVIRDSKTHSKVTAKNHHFSMVNFLKFCDHKVFKKGDAPKTTRGKPIRMYKTDELERVYALCSPYLRIVYETYLKSGMREMELAHAYKTNVVKDEDGWTIRVEEKEVCEWHDKWSPKTWEERSIRIPAALGEALVAFGKSYVPESLLLFPREDGKLNGHLLRELKQVVAKAKMDPAQFRLHAFRSTFTTTLLRKGLGYAEIRQQLGHKPGSDTIYKYIAALEGKALQAKIEEIWA